MSFIRSMLLPGEKILNQVSTSKIAIFNAFVMFALLMQFKTIIRMLRTELALTSQRIIGKTGFIGSQTIALPHAKILAVHSRQGVLGKIFDYGSVIIVDQSGRRIMFRSIALPQIFEQEANEAIELAVLGHKLSDYIPED